MLSSRSSGTEDDGNSGIRLTGSGIRKLSKRKGEDRPKVVRLGTNKSKSGNDDEPKNQGVHGLGARNAGDLTDDRRLSDSFQGSDSERSEISGFSFADEWNARPVPRIAEEQPWSMSDSSEWEKISVEPPFVKKFAHKCGPDGDEDMPRSFPRLQAPGSPDSLSKQTKDRVSVTKSKQIQAGANVIAEPSPDKELSLDEKFPEPPTHNKQSPQTQTSPSGGWSLRNSWLGNISKSVASLTTNLTQNIGTTLDSPKDAKEDFKALIAERIRQEEETKPKTGRKYLHEYKIDDSFTQQPTYAHQVRCLIDPYFFKKP